MPAGKTPTRKIAATKRRGGRPTRTAAEKLGDHILDVATRLMLSHGYGATSIEAIATQAGVSKRTFYHRFPDKPALLGAVVTRIIDGLRPAADTPLIAGKTLEEMLLHLGALIVRSALDPRALALHRLVVAESSRFPDLAAALASAGGRSEAVTLIGDLLVRHAPGAALKKDAAAFAAEQFLQMIVSLPQMRAMGLAEPMTPREINAWLRRSVALLLGGVNRLQ